jgi:hypothetical protein
LGLTLSSLTKYNLIISVLTTFMLLVKSIMIIMKVMLPPLSLVIHAAEMAIYVYSAYAQTSPDISDPQHPNNGPPWFITKSCNVAALREDVGYCQMAKGAFYVAVFMAYVSTSSHYFPTNHARSAMYGVHVILAIMSMLFAPEKREDDQESLVESKGKGPEEPTWEMVPIPGTPRTPYHNMPMSPMTPRTKAFESLQAPAKLTPYGGGFAPPPKKPFKK